MLVYSHVRDIYLHCFVLKIPQCLSILNYFRSVECTLTINCEGLSLESPREQHPSAPAGLLDHKHLFNTPADYVYVKRCA